MSTYSEISKNSPPPSVKAKAMTVPKFQAAKGGTPLVCLTAYTAPMAEIMDPHVDLMLVGDSLGMVLYGLPSTVAVTLDMMIAHGAAVVRGASTACVIVDMPFASYGESPQQAYRNAACIMQETGCAGVKLEGGVVMAETIEFLTSRGIPVMAHIGVQPQSVNAKGYKARGGNADTLILQEDIRAVENAGAFSVVLECVAEPLAVGLTSDSGIPTIGIGASAGCDGQILVAEDMLGMTPQTPKFVKHFGAMRELIDSAVDNYAREVRGREFPGTDNCYIPPE